MDETSRALERAASQGDAIARVRLANERLRAGDPEGALAVLPPAPANGLIASTRALALKRLGGDAIALESLEVAIASGIRDFEPRAVLEALERMRESASILERARSARVLSRVAAADDEVRGSLAKLVRDENALVRVACITDRPPYEHHDRTTRPYGSHGPDYETGHFISFEASLELRLRTFEPALFGAVEQAFMTGLREITVTRRLLPDYELRAAFGEGYGLAAELEPLDEVELRKVIVGIDSRDILPFRVTFHARERSYDLVTDEKKLARRLGRDLLSYPARQKPYDPNGTLLERFLALHPLRGDPAPPERVAPLLEEARSRYTETGVRALESFLVFLKGAERGFF